MKKFHSGLLAVSALMTASAAFAVGTQAPVSLTNAGGTRPTYNGYTDQEISTAIMRANDAASGKDLPGIKEHLHSVINCLAGPNGPGYDSSVENPCARMGRGALNDVPADSDEHRLLTQAFNEAKNGLTLSSVSDAKSTAKQVLNDLENAKTAVQQ